MTPRERFIKALKREVPDRLPVTTHHVQPSFLKKYMKGADEQDFFDKFGLDPILWLVPHKPDESKGCYFDPTQKEHGFLEIPRICHDNWRIESKPVDDSKYETKRFNFITPDKTLSMVLQSDQNTTWVSERMIKEKSDIEILAKFAPAPLCDTDEVNRKSEAFGQRGLVRGLIPPFDVYGQSGCWQDAAVLYGIEPLIMETFTDPDWVNSFLKILFERKKIFLQSMEGADFDILEHGGGDASSTIISPQIFEQFVAPFDAELTRVAQSAGQRVVYHTCGGMMPLLEQIADLGVDAMETFTPAGMGGDARLSEAKKRIGDRVCMIGGFDQFHYFVGCTEGETRREVRRCFEEAGENGGYILCPSDHFFEADPALISAFADEAKKCRY